MKLIELTIPMDTDTGPIDDMQSRDNEDAMASLPDMARRGQNQKRHTPAHNSNVAKAKRIRNLAQLKKRESNPEQSETPHKYNLGGHVSTFLNR